MSSLGITNLVLEAARKALKQHFRLLEELILVFPELLLIRIFLRLI
jgi:hypothetical protein